MWSSTTFIALVSICVVLGNMDILLPKCQQPLHHGVQNCTNTSSLRFYVDGDTLAILAFKYSGCGGNSNNFKTFEDTLRCFPMDWNQCPISSAQINNLNSNSSECNTDKYPKCTGPNAYCNRGAYPSGFCCDKTVRDKERSDISRSTGCSAGSRKVAFDSSTGFTITLLGKTCESNFCPQKSTCHQGNYYAYCCEVY
ncbi:unnamed protein product [Caenorhabditis brenneri]